jgi:hypothetical protein
LIKGRRLFHGSLAEARLHFSDLQSDASLEEIFFRATEQTAAVASMVPQSAIVQPDDNDLFDR